MKKLLLALTIFSLLFMSCNTTKVTTNKSATIAGTWELNYITGPRITFDGLYPNKKPTIIFDLEQNSVSGNNSCNSYSGKLNSAGNTISFKDPMAVTKMMCMDGMLGETTYMEMLQKIDSYTITADGKILNLLMGDIAMMRFEKK